MYKLNKKNKIIITSLVIVIFFAIIYYSYYANGEEDIVSYNTNFFENKNEENKKNQIQEENNAEIIVHVAGCVVNQGIIKLSENSRISDAIDAAGGLTEEADISNINLALIIEDGMKIYVPSIKDKEENKEYEIQVDTVLNNISQNTNKKININTANEEELETLPGIGSSTAQKILIYRKENGKFNSIEDIKSVKGIGTSKFEKIKELICVK